MDNLKSYNQYLSTISLKGYLYKKLWLYPKLRKILPLPSLDIGCGMGQMLLSHPGMIGIDINPYNIEVCKRKKLNVFLVEANEIPFEDNSLASILLDNVVEHIENPALLFCELLRVLKKNGYLIVGLPGDKGYKLDLDHKINYKSDDFIKIMETVGFKFYYLFHAPFNSAFLNQKASFYCRYFIFHR
jgi:SAM-dependent methyltransferase